MTQDELNDGVRIAQLLSSEVTGGKGRLRALAVSDADPDVEPTTDGTLGYTVRATDVDVESARDDDALAEVYVQPDRARVEFVVAPELAADVAQVEDLRVRPKATRPPRTLVFVENGAQVKWVLPVFEAVLDEVRRGER